MARAGFMYPSPSPFPGPHPNPLQPPCVWAVAGVNLLCSGPLEAHPTLLGTRGRVLSGEAVWLDESRPFPNPPLWNREQLPAPKLASVWWRWAQRLSEGVLL